MAFTGDSFDNGKGAMVYWTKTGGPVLSGPSADRGFGMRLLRRALHTGLGPGSGVILDLRPDGLPAVVKIKLRVTPSSIAQFVTMPTDHATGHAAP